MQFEEYGVAFAKTKIVCHGACATRIGERLIRHVWKYLRETEFVKGNISENERKEMFNSISLTSLISYPKDVENSDTGCDIMFQIVFDDDEIGLKQAKCINRDYDIPNITFVIGRIDKEKLNIPFIEFDSEQIQPKAKINLRDVFLDLFSVYTFPQEYGADFEELRPLFKHKGQIYVASSEYLDQSVLENYIKYALVIDNGKYDSINFEKIKGESTVVLSSRKFLKGEELKKRGYIIIKEEPYFDYNFEGIVNDMANNNGLFSIFSHSGFGKTTLALQFIKGVLEKNGGKALILSQEMSKETMTDCATRFLDKEKIIVNDDASSIYDAPFDIASKYIKENSEISVVFVDHIFWNTSKSLRDYKRINTDYKIPVLLTASLPRFSGDYMPRDLPMLTDINCTTPLIQDSDYIIFLHRDHRAIRSVGTRENKDVSKKAQLIVAKNRYGERDVVAEANWNDKKCIFEF